MKKTSRVGLIAISVIGAALLLLDATQYSLMPSDPESGRRAGCYTVIETWVGVKEPSIIRDTEKILVVVLMALIPVILIFLRPKKRTDKSRSVIETPMGG